MDEEKIKAIFREVISDERKSFWIEPEVHYDQHKYLGEAIKTGAQIKTWSLRTIVVSVVAGAIAWFTMHIKG